MQCIVNVGRPFLRQIHLSAAGLSLAIHFLAGWDRDKAACHPANKWLDVKKKKHSADTPRPCVYGIV